MHFIFIIIVLTETKFDFQDTLQDLMFLLLQIENQTQKLLVRQVLASLELTVLRKLVGFLANLVEN